MPPPPRGGSVLLLLASLLCAPPPSRASYVPCEACDPKAQALCAPVPAGCREPVKEPGCGCCLTCALEAGRPCGVYTGPCARGLRCLPRDDEEKPLRALLHGRGACRKEKLLKLLLLQPPEGESSRREEPSLHRLSGLLGVQAKVPLYGGRDHVGSRKIQAMRQARERSKQLARQGISWGDLDHKPLALDKLQPQFGPCRTRLDNVIQSMRESSRVAALSLYLPNCDKKGFFKRKQCKPSRGRKRGICWCVDRLGLKVAGSNYSGGDLQCKELDDSNSNE
ncbi:unnamed protein product [Merluccius merluccius]